jgi:predicted RND superfamily exporter protein
MLTMREAGLEAPRLAVVQELRSLARSSGFDVTAIGGLYYLQGHLGAMVRTSLVSGLLALLALFLVVGLAASRSLTTSGAMVAAIALAPLATLGGLGLTGTPVDVISSPASNVCIGMAADAMIHLVLAVRRRADGAVITWAHWVAARREQATPILISTGLVISGFAIFTLSVFPPTRRFGGAVIFGTLVAAFGALVLLPALAAPRPRESG